MGEGGEVARGPEGSLFGDDGQDVLGEHLDKAQHDFPADTRVAEGEDVGRRASMARTSSEGSSLPTATAWERRSPCWRAVECSGVRWTSESAPKPVVTP